ncbi:MAG TPA: sigma factor-like helix-turn-helix DNA-binding protein [Thermoleophilia bacterium]
MDVLPDVLLHELRLGEREAFSRYYELYRAPVYDLVRRLLHDGDDAVSATTEAFTTAYSRILLRDDGIGLREETYRAAFDVCSERLAERDVDRGATLSAAWGADRRERSDLGRRVGQTLETLPSDAQAVLLLHDLNGLGPPDLAIVFGLTTDAAGALLFRAREAFRRAFDELSSGGRASQCRLAEQTAAGAVGRGLSNDEARRLHEHAGYCRNCRQTMKGWGGSAISLALFFDDAPLPRELETTPVFATTVAIIGASSAASGSGTLTRALARIGRPFTSRAAAYALAAACLALSVGLAVHHSPGAQTFIVLSATGPNVARAAHQATRVVPPLGGSSRHTSTTSARVATRSAVATSSTRSATSSSDAIKSSSAATESEVTIVADLGGSTNGGRSPVGGPSPVGHPGASSAEAPRAVTYEGVTRDGVKATNAGPVSVDSGRSASASGSGAEPAKPVVGNGAPHHTAEAAKVHAGTHLAHKQSRKNH